jgi:uncharacterized protein YabN with tetrapyrrole methylase and pyrophosphatase domain
VGWVQFILAIPKMLSALQSAFAMYKKMQSDKFYSDSLNAFAKLDEAKTDDEIKESVIAIRNLYKRV